MVGESLDVDADRVIDAAGKYVFPGCVDPHAPRHAVRWDGHDRRRHIGPDGSGLQALQSARRFRDPASGSRRSRRRSTSGGPRPTASRSSTWATTWPSPTSARRHARGGSPGCRAGVTSCQLFMAYRARSWSTTRRSSGRWRSPPRQARSSWSAENSDAIDVLVKQALAAGNTAPHFHTFDASSGDRARQRTARSSSRGWPERRSTSSTSRARGRRSDRACARAGLGRVGRDLRVLLRRLHVPRAPRLRGAKYVYTPPPRSIENQEVLWHAVRSDILSVVSTDHCAFLWDGQKTMGRDDFSKIPNGGPGEQRPPAHDPRVRRRDRVGSPEPHGRAAVHEPGQALRPVPAEEDDRAGSDAT